MPEKKNMPYNRICFILKTYYSHEAYKKLGIRGGGSAFSLTAVPGNLNPAIQGFNPEEQTKKTSSALHKAL
tara:strand:- start:2085 stop:2297 length:213 start_codon:yes stop_codon:yes gene_type:complete